MIDFERLLRVLFVDMEIGFDISPDGKHIAFSWNTTVEWENYEREFINDQHNRFKAGRRSPREHLEPRIRLPDLEGMGG